MTRTNPSPAAGEFDAFLYAPIVVESNGMLLSVLSALARLNLDPWEEAARLARLPCDVATRTLIKLIAALPNGLPERLDVGELARQLVALLPRDGAARADTARSPRDVREITIDGGSVISRLVLYMLLMLIFLGAVWLMRPLQEVPHPGAAASSPAQAVVPAAYPTRD
jgi:hypothetical protein